MVGKGKTLKFAFRPEIAINGPQVKSKMLSVVSSEL